MDVIGRVRRAAFARPRVLMLPAPAGVATRLAVERYSREHGWPTAESAADADLLVVVGPLDVGLAAVAEVLARQTPAPWVRVDLGEPEKVSAALGSVPAQLARWKATVAGRRPDGGHDSAGGQHASQPEDHGGPDQHGDPREHRRLDASPPGSDRSDGAHQHGEVAAEPMSREPDAHDDHEMSAHGDHGMSAHGGHEMSFDGGGMSAHGGHERSAPAGHDGSRHGGGRTGSGHEGHGMPGDGMSDHRMSGHDGHDMGPVAGLPMAGRGPDRDGLKLDVLHVPLGPVLPFWPAGLRLSLTIQGDVVQQAAVQTLGVASGVPFWNEPVLRVLAGESVPMGTVARRRAASYLDSLHRLLGVAGWESAALRCAWLRDRTLAGEASAVLLEDFSRLRRSVDRSRTLAAMTSRVGLVDGGMANRYGISGPAATAAGDVADRTALWFHLTGEDLGRADDPTPATTIDGPRGPLDRDRPPSAELLAALPSLVLGAELASVRLIVASLDPDVSELAMAEEVTARG